jgi:hypothetical protein
MALIDFGFRISDCGLWIEKYRLKIFDFRIRDCK